LEFGFRVSEEGLYLRLIDFLYHSTLGVRETKKKRSLTCNPSEAELGFGVRFWGGARARERGLSLSGKLGFSGFRVQGSVFRVQGSGFRDQGFGFRVQGSGFKLQGSVFRIQGSRFTVRGLGFGFRGERTRVRGAPASAIASADGTSNKSLSLAQS